MTEAAVFLLLHQIVIDAVFRVQVGVYVQGAHIVEKVEIKVAHLALLQLALKDLLDFVHVGKVIPREF